MPNRHSGYERWEVLLMTFFLAYRWLIFICGVIFLVYVAVVWRTFPIVAILVSVLSITLLAMVFSDRFMLSIARIIARIIVMNKE